MGWSREALRGQDDSAVPGICVSCSISLEGIDAPRDSEKKTAWQRPGASGVCVSFRRPVFRGGLGNYSFFHQKLNLQQKKCPCACRDHPSSSSASHSGGGCSLFSAGLGLLEVKTTCAAPGDFLRARAGSEDPVSAVMFLEKSLLNPGVNDSACTD